MSSTILFNKVLSVLKIQDGDKRKCDILFTIEEVVHSIKKEVNLRLTDDSDQFFLFQLKITEEDFQHLKTQQGLLIDFRAFPQKVIEMLEDCRERSSRDVSRFSLVFTLSGYGGLHSVGVLSIVETNEFKQLDHLRLEFHPGTDADIKNYLLRNLKDTKQKLEQMTTAFSKVQYDVQHYKDALTTKSIETSEVRGLCEEKMREVEKINEQKMSDMRRRHADDVKSLEDKHASSMRRLEQKLADATETAQTLKETKHRHENQIADLKSKISSWDEERGSIQSEATKLRRDHASLQSRLSERDFQLSETMSRLSMMEKDVASKDDTLKKEHSLLLSERESKRKLEEDMDAMRREMTKDKEKLEKLIKKLTAIHKENFNLKKEHEEQQSKLERRTIVSGKQEQHIMSLSEDIDKLRKSVEMLSTENASLMQQSKAMEIENAKLRSDLDKSRQHLKENGDLISWLSKKADGKEMHYSRDFSQTGRTPSSGSTNRNMAYTLESRNNNNNECGEGFLEQKFLCNSMEDARIESGKPMSPSLPPTKQQPSPNSANPSQGRHSAHHKVNPTSKPVRDVPNVQPVPNLSALRGVPPIGNPKNISPRNVQYRPPMGPPVSSYFHNPNTSSN